MKEFMLKILTPEKSFFTGKVTKVITEDKSGSIGILGGHEPMVGMLVPSVTTFVTEEGEKKAFISQGILKVDSDSVSLLCDAAEWPEDIDFSRAEKAKERAEKRLKEKDNNLDVLRAEIALKRSLTRLKLNTK